MNPIKSLEETIKTKKKSLSERQFDQLNAAITYLKELKIDFFQAKKTYDETIKELRDR